MGDNIIEVKNLTKEYITGDISVKACDGINFEISRGEFVVVLGPSGSGKSTVLNIIGGMDRPTLGEVWVDGKNIAKFSEKELTLYRRNNIGFIFQFYNLIPNLTAIENVELVTQVTNNPLSAKQVMKDIGLSEREGNFPAQLSGGEQQRVAIARAIAKNPLMLLCDEPTGALDYKTGKIVLKLLHDMNKNMKKTTILITHNSAIAGMADRVIRLRSGAVEEIVVNENPVPPERIEW